MRERSLTDFFFFSGDNHLIMGHGYGHGMITGHGSPLFSLLKKNVFWGDSPKSVHPPTHPKFFVRFGRTKGEIRVEKGNFWGDFGRFLRGFDLVWESATPPYLHLSHTDRLWKRLKNNHYYMITTNKKILLSV